MESGKVKSLNNQVLCMISKYHLTCLSQGSSYISPVLPEAVQDLLPPMEEYLAEDGFRGTRDLRVEGRAKTFRVAVWLHRLDMAVTGDETASSSLDIARHGRRPLLEFLLAPQASSLTFEEVVQWVLAENRHRTESSLDDVQKFQDQLQRELKDLSQAYKAEPGSKSVRTLKVSRLPSRTTSPVLEGPGSNQKEPQPVMTIHLTQEPRVLKRRRWLLHQ